MKIKMAIVLSTVLTCSLSMTALAAPSPSIILEPVTQTMVSTPVVIPGTTSETTGVMSEKSAVLNGTTFKTQGGLTVDPAAVKLVVEAVTEEQAQLVTNSLVNAIVSPKIQILNFTGRDKLYLTDNQNRVVAVNTITVSLRTDAGELVSHNGSVSAAFNLANILSGHTLAQGETVQAMYRRADGTWIAVPIIIRNGVAAIALPAFSAPVNVTFLVVKGKELDYVPPTAGKSPNT